MTLVNSLKDICSDLKGTFLSIGLSYPTVVSALEKNKNISCGYLFNFEGKKKGKGKDKNNYKQKGKLKKASIKKLRKTFKKKSVDTVMCYYQDIEKYIRFFIADSIYINCGKLYIYGKKTEFVLEDLKRYYDRYNTKIEITEYEEHFLVEIDNTKAKNNWFKDKCYRIKDSISYYINCIGDFLVG